MGVDRHLLRAAVEAGETAVGPSPESVNRTGNAELTRANFDTNMVIILAALLCALIFALGLNSMVRCVLRCTHRAGPGSGTRTGLKKSVLKKIPVFVHGSGSGSGSGLDTGSECPICLGEFVDGDKVRVLPDCNHGFHVSCIDTWLGSHSSCPNCRHSLLGAATSSKATALLEQPPQSGGGGGGGGDGSGGGGGGGREEHVVEMPETRS